MSLLFHELIHFSLSIFSGIFILKIFSKKKNNYLIVPLLITSLLAGFFIDLDHLFDYFLAFGFNFRADYFLKGYQFLKSGKMYIPLHSFEIIILLFIIYYLISIGFKKIKGLTTLRLYGLLALSLSLSMFFHLVFDIVQNKLPLLTYSFIYRVSKKFELKDLVYPSHYRYHMEQKRKLKVESL